VSAIRKSKWIISSNKASSEVNIHVNAKLVFSSWRTMFVWSGNFQGHVCAGRFTRPCIVHTTNLHKTCDSKAVLKSSWKEYTRTNHIKYTRKLQKKSVKMYITTFSYYITYTCTKLFFTSRQNSVWTMHGRVNRPAQTWPWKFPLQIF
jgi:hypothetical protein